MGIVADDCAALQAKALNALLTADENPWISVEDALPEPDNGEEQNYLVEDESGYRHAESAWMLKHLLHHPRQPCSPPVAWMPIPERKV